MTASTNLLPQAVPRQRGGSSTSSPLKAALKSGEVERLVRKYSTSAPRYTSYPTAVEFTEAVQSKEWEAELLADREILPLSLYFHIPFCESLCYFCACNKIVTKDHRVSGPYLEALLKEITMYRSILPECGVVHQIHWGGGSPNFLRRGEIERLQRATFEAFPNLSENADISVEVDPRTTTVCEIEALAGVGFNRLSLGVQDFDEAVQKVVNRLQSFEITAEVIECAREHGFRGVNVDLIYGLPLQTVAGFSRTIDRVLSLRPDRVALYGYAHVTWLKKVQKSLERATLPTPSERIAIFSEAIHRFNEAGYIHIGMDHFALPSDSLAEALRDGRLNRNFMGYSTHRGTRLIGMGVSAISTLPNCFAQNVKDLALYEERVASGVFPIERGLKKTREDRLRGEIIESLLCRGEVVFAEFETRWDCSIPEKFAPVRKELDEFAEDGILTMDSDAIRLSGIGRLFARNVAMVFDEYLPRHRTGEKPVFSQSI